LYPVTPEDVLAVQVRPTVAVVTPVPLKLTVIDDGEALLAIEMLPVAFPAEVGEKPTVAVACWPTAIDRGNETPVRVNSEPVSEA